MSLHTSLNQSQPQLPSSKQPPTLHTQKLQLLRVDTQIQQLQNRILSLKQKQKKQRQSVELHRQKATQLLHRKLQISQIQKLKSRDDSDDVRRREMLLAKNQKAREDRRKQMKTILEACFLVRMDEAREIKEMTERHEEKIREMRGEVERGNGQRRGRVKEIEGIARKRYVQYWRNRLIQQNQHQNQTIKKIVDIKEQKLDYLDKLKEEEEQLTKKVNKAHRHSLQTKKDYFTAMNIPIRQITSVIASSMDSRQLTKQSDPTTPRYEFTHQKTSQSNNSPPKLPKTHLNQAKLRLVLNQLKKMQRQTQQQL